MCINILFYLSSKGSRASKIIKLGRNHALISVFMISHTIAMSFLQRASFMIWCAFCRLFQRNFIEKVMVSQLINTSCQCQCLQDTSALIQRNGVVIIVLEWRSMEPSVSYHLHFITFIEMSYVTLIVIPLRHRRGEGELKAEQCKRSVCGAGVGVLTNVELRLKFNWCTNYFQIKAYFRATVL